LDAQTCVAGSQLPQFNAGRPHPAGALPQTQPVGHAVVGTHTPQTFAVPPPPHVSPDDTLQPPQCSVEPQPSLKSPQSFPAMHAFGVQHFSAWQMTAASPIVEQGNPQSSCPPQPSPIMPQLLAAQLFFMQTPQTLVVPPPPHVSPAVMQLPQSSCPPQPSLILPQFLPCAAQVVGVQHLLL